jgi:hypothetical protein
VRGVIAGGSSEFRLVVQKSAGRFRLAFVWERYTRTETSSDEFVVTPHRLVASGIADGQQFVVGSRHVSVIGTRINDLCASGAVLDAQDVRCQGAAALPALEVKAVDGSGGVLDGLGEDLGFKVTVSLLQGRGGREDVAYQLLPLSDVFFMDMLAAGGVHDDSLDRSGLVANGTASFVSGQAVFIRRQAGRFYRLLFTLLPSDTTLQPWLATRSNAFSIVARLLVHPWAPGASEASGAAGMRSPAPTHPFMPLAAEIPRVRVQIVDAYGNILSHANCAACLTLSMRTPPDEPCDAFGIRSNLADCMAELPWHERPDSYCATSVNYGEFLSLARCKELCQQESKCQALHWYPMDQVGSNDVYFGSSCFLALGPCVPLPRFLLYAFCFFKRMC